MLSTSQHRMWTIFSHFILFRWLGPWDHGRKITVTSSWIECRTMNTDTYNFHHGEKSDEAQKNMRTRSLKLRNTCDSFSLEIYNEKCECASRIAHSLAHNLVISRSASFWKSMHHLLAQVTAIRQQNRTERALFSLGVDARHIFAICSRDHSASAACVYMGIYSSTLCF